jgi:hypothetical protein
MFIFFIKKYGVQPYIKVIIYFTFFVYLIGVLEAVFGIHWLVSKWGNSNCNQPLSDAGSVQKSVSFH